MKPYAHKPFTPNMRKAVLDLLDGKQPEVGQPTKQRIVKFGLARWTRVKIGDGLYLESDPVLELTARGRALATDAAGRRRKPRSLETGSPTREQERAMIDALSEHFGGPVEIVECSWRRP